MIDAARSLVEITALAVGFACQKRQTNGRLRSRFNVIVALYDRKRCRLRRQRILGYCGPDAVCLCGPTLLRSDVFGRRCHAACAWATMLRCLSLSVVPAVLPVVRPPTVLEKPQRPITWKGSGIAQVEPRAYREAMGDVYRVGAAVSPVFPCTSPRRFRYLRQVWHLSTPVWVWVKPTTARRGSHQRATYSAAVNDVCARVINRKRWTTHQHIVQSV
jgi:hypothetical protein